jgi:hypothetical protein
LFVYLLGFAKLLQKVCAMVEHGWISGRDEIGLRVGKVIVRNTCRSPEGSSYFDIDTLPDGTQRRAVELLSTINK